MLTNIVVMTITAYCHCATCCTKANQPTASGRMPSTITTIAASRSLPFGTSIFIPSIGWKRVEDRLARKYDNRIDVFMSSHRKARKFGIRQETVQVVTMK